MHYFTGALTLTDLDNIYDYTFADDHAFGGHRHAAWELNAVLDGQLQVTDESRVILLRGGDALLLEPERATYSDMAVTLRRFLQENGTLPKAAAAADAVPVTVEWLITVRRNELLRAGDLVMTSFDGVDTALTALEDAGVKNTRSLLLGWQKEGVGVYPQSVSPSGSAGGKAGLSRLLATAGGGREFYLETDYVQANGEGRFNKRQDAATAPRPCFCAIRCGRMTGLCRLILRAFVRSARRGWRLIPSPAFYPPTVPSSAVRLLRTPPTPMPPCCGRHRRRG